MKALKLAALSLAVLATAAVPAFTQEKKEMKAPETPEATAPMDPAMMEAMEKAATPGEHHKHLARSVGKWTVTTKMFMPGQPPMETSGTMEGEMVLGGRYLQSVFKSTMMGQPFEGRSLDAYDNASQSFVNTWIDNMGTGVLVSHGDCSDPSCKVVTFTGIMVDPMTGGKVTTKNVTTWQDADHYKMEMWSDDGKGNNSKAMELYAARVK
jgi:hypothetical protein